MNSTRRDLFRFATAASLAMAAPAAENKTMIGVPFTAKSNVRLGFIGLGGRGTGQMRNFAAANDVEVTAICDIVPEKLARASQLLKKGGQQKEPELYSDG